jgi:hypothetical protein
LPGVARVGHDFLIAHHRGVEDNLAKGLAQGTASAAEKAGPILKRKQGLRLTSFGHKQVHLGAPHMSPELSKDKSIAPQNLSQNPFQSRYELDKRKSSHGHPIVANVSLP